MAETRRNGNGLDHQRTPPSIVRRCLSCFSDRSYHIWHGINYRCDRLVQSIFWKTILAFCTVVLLFGAPLQFLCSQRGADSAFDVVYLVVLGVFILDMAFNLMVDPEYFKCPKCIWKPHQAKFWNCGIGSFMFYCDALSIVGLLRDISYVNPKYFSTMSLVLELDEYGIAVSVRVYLLFAQTDRTSH